jgi:acyl dehydratase
MTWDEVVTPADLLETVDEISYERVVMNAGATWDYVPWHFDPVYAQSHGNPGIFVNTMHLAGFVDRIATEWAGPYSRVVRRKATLLGSIYAGDSMVGRSRVIDKRRDDTRHLVDLEIAVYNQRGEL